MGNSCTKLRVHIHIFVDDHHFPKNSHKKMINQYILQNKKDINTLYIFVKNQNERSVCEWKRHFRYHPFRQHVKIIYDLLIADNGYISAMYKLRDMPTTCLGGALLKFTCIFDDSELKQKYGDFLNSYLKFKKKHLPKHCFAVSVPHLLPDGNYQFLNSHFLEKNRKLRKLTKHNLDEIDEECGKT